MGFSLRVSHCLARYPHQRPCRIVLNTNNVEKINWLTYVALVTVTTLRDVNIVKCTFSMLTSLTSGIKLNHIKGPNNPIFVFNYSYMVRQLVLEALQDVSRDSELIKYEQKTTFSFTFSSSFNRPLRKFFENKVYPKRLWNISYVNGTWLRGQKESLCATILLQ